MASGADHQHYNSAPSTQFVAAGTQNNNSGSGTQYNAQNITFHADQEDDTRLFADIRITDPRDDKDRIERTKGGLLHDSYRWILENPDFQAWKSDADARLLWVRGDPGKGKPMLLCGIINELESMGAEPVYFFCQATDSRLNTATAVLRGLMYLLLQKRPSLIQYVREKHKHGGKQLFEDANSWIALRKILVEMLVPVGQGMENIVLVIDGLDECTTNLVELLDLLVQLSSNAVRVIASSRNWSNIREVISTTQRHYPLCLELNGESVADAVSSYTSYRVNRLAALKGYDTALRDEVRSYLNANSNGTFLWVALVTQRIAEPKVSRRHTLMVLREFPAGLDALYDRMLNQTLESMDSDLCKRILAAASAAFRPLGLQEMAALTNVMMNDMKSLEEVVMECGSLLVLKDHVVYFVHQSAKDFVLNYAVDKIMPRGIEKQHNLMFLNSLNAMDAILQRNIYGLPHDTTDIAKLNAPDPDPLAPILYACTYWVRHFDNACLADLRGFRHVHVFLARHFLHWLEALVLKDCEHICASCIFQLKDFMEGFADVVAKHPRLQHLWVEISEVISLLQDALRFIRYHHLGFEANPLQVYMALNFTPAHSIMRNLFQHEMLQWVSISMEPPIADRWDACLQTLEPFPSGQAKLAAFSQDGITLAVALTGEYAQIWNVVTGTWTHNIETDTLSALATSSYDNTVVGACNGNLIFWNMFTGEERKRCSTGEIKATGETTSLVFAPNGVMVASGSGSGGIHLWDLTEVECQRSLRPSDHKASVESLAFSSDGLCLAAAVASNIEVWDVGTGRRLHKIEAHDAKVQLVAFSCTDNSIQSASTDDSVKVWDIKTGSCLRTTIILHGRATAFSSKLDRVATSTASGCVRIWDASTGYLLATFEGGEIIKSLVFSPNDNILAAVVPTRGTKLWDLTGELKVTSPERVESPLQSLAFAPDGTRLVAVSNTTLEIWDTHTRRCLQKLDEPLHCASVTFVNSDLLLAKQGILDTDIIEVWNVTSGYLLQSFTSDSTVEAVGFSPDSTVLAIVTRSTICLWDIAKGHCVSIYQTPGSYRWVDEIRFSTTGSHLYHPELTDEAIQLDTPTVEASGTPSVAICEAIEVPGYSIQDDFSWIKKNGKDVLWLPPEYRTWTYATSGSRMALGCESGRIVFLQFDT